MTLANLLRWWLFRVSLGVVLQACLVSGDRCDVNQVRATPGLLEYCECAPGTVPDSKGYGCTRCAKHEVVRDGKCECTEGFARSSSSEACEESTAATLGSMCSDSSMCSEPYAYCASDGEEHYCSRRDCSDDDCPSGYTCETRSDATFCAKLPSGIGEPCTSNDSCTGFAAAECDTFNMRCVLGGCATGKLSCPSTWSCCDLSMFVPGVSFCSAPGEMCVGKVVTP